MNAIMLAVQTVIAPLMRRLESIEKASAPPQGLTLPAMRHFTHTHEPHTQEVSREHNPQSWPQQGPMELETGPTKTPKVSPIALQPTNRHAGQGDEWQTAPPTDDGKKGVRHLDRLTHPPTNQPHTALLCCSHSHTPQSQPLDTRTSQPCSTTPTPPALTEVTLLRFNGTEDISAKCHV